MNMLAEYKGTCTNCGRKGNMIRVCGNFFCDLRCEKEYSALFESGLLESIFYEEDEDEH